ncbi:MAG: hypothetical protein AAGB19_19635 [Cyanobacteria bacterium P01_F01_bin.3]
MTGTRARRFNAVSMLVAFMAIVIAATEGVRLVEEYDRAERRLDRNKRTISEAETNYERAIPIIDRWNEAYASNSAIDSGGIDVIRLLRLNDYGLQMERGDIGVMERVHMPEVNLFLYCPTVVNSATFDVRVAGDRSAGEKDNIVRLIGGLERLFERVDVSYDKVAIDVEKGTASITKLCVYTRVLEDNA